MQRVTVGVRVDVDVGMSVGAGVSDAGFTFCGSAKVLVGNVSEDEKSPEQAAIPTQQMNSVTLLTIYRIARGL